MAWNGQIPFCSITGHMQDWDNGYQLRYEDNFQKSMLLRYKGYSRGRSSVAFEWEDTETGVCYPMFLTDMDDLLKAGLIAGNHVSGVWTATKRGTNFGIKRIGDIPG